MRSTGDLVLAELAFDHGEDGGGNGDRPLPELVGALGIPPDRLSDRMELVSALEDLRNRGLVVVAEPGDGPLVYAPTEAGSTRGMEISSELEESRVTVVDDDRRELSMRQVAARYDRSLLEVAASLTDDGRYYVEPSTDWQLVGRDEELDRCREILEAAADTDRGRGLFLTGPGGIGKTTLAERVCDEFADAEFDIVRVRGRGTDSEPYRVIQEALGEGGSGAPVISDGGAVTGDVDGFQAQQTGLFHEFTEQLTPDPAEPMRLLHVDDLHRSDLGTLAYLSYLMERFPDGRLCLLASFRPGELPEDAPRVFHDGRNADARDLELATLHLDPLAATETRTVIEQTVGRRGAPGRLVEAIHQWTGGNPLFVEETVNLLLDSGRLDPKYEGYPEDLSVLDVPDVVRTALHERIRGLDEGIQRLLQVAALVGDRVPLPVLEEVIGEAGPEVRPAVTVLASSGVLEWTGGDEISFPNEIFREGLVDEIPAPERRQLEVEIAQALEAAHARDDEKDDRAAQIAGHYDRGGDRIAAIEWYRRAGDHARNAYAQTAAVDHYESAIRLARRLEDDQTVLDLNERLAEVNFFGGEFDQADRHSRFVREQADSPGRRQGALAMAARIANNRGEYDAAFELAAEGLSFENGAARRRVELLLQRASAEDHLGDFDAAIDSAEDALAASEEVDASDLELEAEARLGEIAMKQNRFEAGNQHLRRALDIAEQLDDRHRSARIQMALGAKAHHQGDLPAVQSWNERALEGFEAVGDPHGKAKAEGNLGMVARRRGDYGRARERFQQAIQSSEALGDHHSAARHRANRANVALSQGAYEAASEAYERALEVFIEVGERREVAMARNALGFIALKQHQIETARDYLRPALEAFQAIDRRSGIGGARIGLGIINTIEGEYTTARNHLEQAQETLQEVGNRSRLTTARLALAHLDTLAESPDRGLERWDTIAEHLDTIDPSYSVEPFERLIDACLTKGDREAAREWCDRPLKQFEESESEPPDRLRSFLTEQRAGLQS